MKTGIFFHKIFSQGSWPIIGNKFRNFPKVMEYVIQSKEVALFRPEKVSEELLLKVHTKELIEDTKHQWYYEAACLAVGGCVEATEKILSGEITNAIVFNVAAGHHAGRSRAWGGTYLSCAGPALIDAREKFGDAKFAIIDTDCHHGDGTRDIFLGDKDILHVCFCSSNRIEDAGTKIDVNVGWNTNDEDYLNKVRKEFILRAREFQPKLILHNLGHDTCTGDYGDRGLTEEFFPRLTREIKKCAEEVCQGRYLIITHGGARSDVADYIFPKIIEILAEG